MAWIDTVDEGDARGRLAELYATMTDPASGRVDNVLKAHSLGEDGLAAHWSLYRSAMRGTKSLRKLERELIAVTVSARNGCHY